MTALPDLRHMLTKAQRRAMDVQIQHMAHLIVPLLMERQDGKCNICGEPYEEMDIDHIVYHPNITLNELQLICRYCHIEKHPRCHVLKAAPRRKSRVTLSPTYH